MDALNQRFDAIVVGSGPGGATVAREMTARGKRVLLLEWGSGAPISENACKQTWHALQGLGWPGKGMLLTTGLMAVVRGICKGGSSTYFYGTCFKVPHEMFARYGIDVREEEAEVRREMPVGPLKDEMMTPMARRMMESARSLGYAWEKQDKFMDQERWTPGYPFGYYGDPNDIKWSARVYVDEAVDGGCLFLDHARVDRVITEGDTATGVEFTWQGQKRRVFGDSIVIAAGGIGSPVILRNSGILEAGYDFFYDPLITVAGVVGDIRARADEIPMSAGVHMAEDGYLMTDMPLPFLLDMAMAAEVFRFHRLFAQKQTLRIMIKIRDSLRGSITDRGGIRKGLAPEDQAILDKGYEVARRILKEAGAKGIYKTWHIASHPGGTVKIGEVLDANLKTRYDNLYVCDCSVIPEPWGLPPVMTLLCLGKRLAKHLTARTAADREA